MNSLHKSSLFTDMIDIERGKIFFIIVQNYIVWLLNEDLARLPLHSTLLEIPLPSTPQIFKGVVSLPSANEQCNKRLMDALIIHEIPSGTSHSFAVGYFTFIHGHIAIVTESVENINLIPVLKSLLIYKQ